MKKRGVIKSWDHTGQEKRVIRNAGGTPQTGYGADGLLRGRPVEVRSCRKDDRYRLMQSTHDDLLNRGGSYLFVAPGRPVKKMTARRVENILESQNRGWYKDRRYPHTFLYLKDVF
jgi:hypothetical protein